jgi:hypothetical protein
VIRLRIAGAAQVLLGVLLAPFALFLGMTPAPVLMLGPLWIIVAGVRMWWPSPRVIAHARRGAWIGLVLGAGETAYGVSVLRAAERSAARGGGLLGGIGLLPLAFGLAIVCVAGLSLLLSRGQRSRSVGSMASRRPSPNQL